MASPPTDPSSDLGSPPGTAAGEAADRPLRSPVWAAIALGALLLSVGAVYGPAASAPFVFDDFEGVVNNRSIHQLWPLFGDDMEPGPLNPPAEIPSAGRPLVNLTLALNYALGGDDPRGYHLVNMALHLAAAFLLWALLRRTLALEFFAGRFDRVAAPLALLAALVWAVHPLATESVEYVSQRTELMMGLCYLATLYAGLRYFQAVSHQGRIGWGTTAALACLAGMACKEVMVSAPLMVLLFERTFVSRSFAGALRRSWPLYLGLAASWGMLFALNIGGPRSGAAGFNLGLSAWEWWFTQAKVFFLYLKLAVWPWPLVVHYEMPYLKSVGEAWPWLLGVGLIVAGTLGLLWRRTAVGFAAAFVLVVLAPTHIVPMATEVAAERRMYLPLAALATMAVVGCHTLARSVWQRLTGKHSGANWSPLAATGACTLGVVVVLAIVSSRRLSAYETALTLWSDSARHQPDDSYVNANLGIALLHEGKAAEAIPLLRKALAADGRNAGERHAALGTALLKTNQLPEAIEQFELSLKLTPDNPDANRNLGHTLLRQGKPREAIPYLERAVALKPDVAESWRDLGAALVNSGRVNEAIPYLEKALEFEPKSAALHRNLGIALGNINRVTDAVHHLEWAVQLDPNSGEVRQYLGLMLMKAGKMAAAADQLREAVRLTPESADAHYHLGAALLGAGQRTQGIAELKEAVRLNPQHKAQADLDRLRAGP